MRFRLLAQYCWLLATGLVIAGLPANAALITYSNRTAFESAVTGTTNVTFDGIVAPDAFQVFPNPAGLTTGGITFRSFGGGQSGGGSVSVYGATLASQSPVLNTGTGPILVWTPSDQSGTASLDILLPTGKTAFAMNIWAQQPFVSTVSALVNSGESTDNFNISTPNRPAPAFFGVISDTNTILLVRWSIPAGQAGLIVDDVTVGTARPGGNPVPEPGSVVMLTAGLFGLILLERRKRLHA
jgi:hypothetical protein